MPSASIGAALRHPPALPIPNYTDELHVNISPAGLPVWEYHGTRSQIEAENLVPLSIQWPQGKQATRWVSGKFSWSLRKWRPSPDNLRPVGDFPSWYSLQCELVKGPSFADTRIERLRRELITTIYFYSSEGQHEWLRKYERWIQSMNDREFQAFKAKVPCLSKHRSTKKQKTVAQGAKA